MPTIYVYEYSGDAPDDGDKLVAEFNGDSNGECEQQVQSLYSDTDYYYATYTAWRK